MTNSWNWKLILEATVYAKGSRSGMYSLFGDALGASAGNNSSATASQTI